MILMRQCASAIGSRSCRKGRSYRGHTRGNRHAAVNDYARSFFYAVDVTQVFRAGDIVERKQVTVLERPEISLRAAVDQLHRHGRDFAIVIDRNHPYQGLVTADSLMAQARLSGAGESSQAR